MPAEGGFQVVNPSLSPRIKTNKNTDHLLRTSLSASDKNATFDLKQKEANKVSISLEEECYTDEEDRVSNGSP